MRPTRSRRGTARPSLAPLDASAELRQEIRDVGGGTRIASVTDLAGTVIGLLQPP
jgi:hypothetical protein